MHCPTRVPQMRLSSVLFILFTLFCSSEVFSHHCIFQASHLSSGRPTTQVNAPMSLQHYRAQEFYLSLMRRKGNSVFMKVKSLSRADS